VKKNSNHVYKAGSSYLLGVLFKVSDGHPRPFYIGVLLGFERVFSTTAELENVFRSIFWNFAKESLPQQAMSFTSVSFPFYTKPSVL